MLLRIDSVQNVGRFHSLASPPQTEDFSKYNLILGYNGSGKTTLSNVLRLFSDRETDPARLFRDISNDRANASVTVRFDTGQVVFRLGCRSCGVYVFNADFITDHLYQGDRFAVKRFDQSVVTEDQLKNPTIARLETQVTQKKQQQDDLTAKKSALQAEFNAIKTAYSTEFNDRIKGARSPSMSIPTEAPSDTLEELRGRLSRAYEDHQRATRHDELTEDAEALDARLIARLESVSLTVRSTLSRSVDAEARTKFKERLDRFQTFRPDKFSLEEWFQNGFRFLRHVQSHQDLSCPLCGSGLTDSLDALLREYGSYFSDEYNKLTRDIDELDQAVDSDLSRLVDNDRNLAALAKLERQHAALLGNASPTTDLETNEVSGFLQRIKSALAKKKANLAQTVELGQDDQSDLIGRYNSAVEKAEKRRLELAQSLRGESKDPGKALTAIRDTMSLCVAAEFDAKDEGNQIANYRNAAAAITGIESETPQLAATLAREIAALRDESRYVNDYLRRLGIRHFHIVLDAHSEVDNVKVQFQSGDSRSALRHSLSESEKTTLAFAYFLSKVRCEVVDNTTARLDNTIIVVDDPVSSLDENRLHATACLIHSEFGGARQLFVLSHNIPFMKFMSNVLGNRTAEANGQSVSIRRDYYLSDVREELCDLPKALRNYTTTYFQKLSNIIDFSQNRLPYEEMRAVLPMFVRTVLETFLSFKLSILAQGSSRERAQSAGLDRLTRNIEGSIGVFTTFPKAGDIDANNVVSQLHDIRRMTDPYVHGSPHDLTEVAFISESELKGLARRALDVICFFDRIHLDRVTQLASS